MSKDYKVYHRYLTSNSKVSNSTMIFNEQSGSGAMPNSTENCIPNYQIQEMSVKEVEKVFLEKYPLQYAILRKKFEKKLKKLLKANEDNDS